MGKKCPSCGKKADWKYFRFDNAPNIVYRSCSYCPCLLIKDTSWHFLNGIDLRNLKRNFIKKFGKEFLVKDQKLTVREKLRREPCPGCGKKMWKFRSKSNGSSSGNIQKWWECRGCGHKQYFV